MSASPLPETAQSPDWPRKVASKVNGQERRVAVLETNGVSRAKGRFVYG